MPERGAVKGCHPSIAYFTLEQGAPQATEKQAAHRHEASFLKQVLHKWYASAGDRRCLTSHGEDL